MIFRHLRNVRGFFSDYYLGSMRSTSKPGRIMQQSIWFLCGNAATSSRAAADVARAISSPVRIPIWSGEDWRPTTE